MNNVEQQLTLFDNNGGLVRVNERGRRVVDLDTGEEMYLQAINKPYYGQKHFWKVFLLDFLAVLGIIESKQLDVVVYVMEHTSPYNNQFQGRYEDIAEDLNISKTTVFKTFKKLLNCNFLTKTKLRGVYQVNPAVMVQGSAAKQRGLLIQYNESVEQSVIDEAAELGVLPDIIEVNEINERQLGADNAGN